MYCLLFNIVTTLVFLNGPTPASLSCIFGRFQANNTIFQTNHYEKMSIQYTVLGFKPTTSQTLVVTHNH